MALPPSILSLWPDALMTWWNLIAFSRQTNLLQVATARHPLHEVAAILTKCCCRACCFEIIFKTAMACVASAAAAQWLGTMRMEQPRPSVPPSQFVNVVPQILHRTRHRAGACGMRVLSERLICAIRPP